MKAIFWIIVAILIAGAVYFFTHPEQKTKAQQFAECTMDMGKIYDGRKSSMSEEKRSQLYAEDLQTCKNLYGN